MSRLFNWFFGHPAPRVIPAPERPTTYRDVIRDTNIESNPELERSTIKNQTRQFYRKLKTSKREINRVKALKDELTNKRSQLTQKLLQAVEERPITVKNSRKIMTIKKERNEYDRQIERVGERITALVANHKLLLVSAKPTLMKYLELDTEEEVSASDPEASDSDSD
jgi:hypothetical protein